MDVHISMCLLISYACQLVTVLTPSLVLTISILTPTITVEVPVCMYMYSVYVPHPPAYFQIFICTLKSRDQWRRKMLQ